MDSPGELDQLDQFDQAREIMRDARDVEAAHNVSFLPDPEPAPGAEIEELCWSRARPAALVSVLQGEGEGLDFLPAEATVLSRRWTAEEGWGEIEEAVCINADCTRAALGHGEPGYYLVGAFGCGSQALSGVEVDEAADGCSPETVHLPLVLEELSPACLGQQELELGEAQAQPGADPSGAAESGILPDNDCPFGFAEPSVIVLTGVIDEDMVLSWTPRVIVSQHKSEIKKTPMACLDRACTMYVDGWGQTGDFQITAELCGEQITKTVSVEPSADGCGVETEWVSFFVDESKCTYTSLAELSE